MNNLINTGPDYIPELMNNELIKLFDDYLCGNNQKDVDDAIDKYGPYSIIKLLEKMNYDKKEQLIYKAIKYAFKNIVIEHPKMEFIYGCRSPISHKFEWNHAFVITKPKNNKMITMTLFENGMDYIGHTTSYNEAIISFNNYINDGWKLMDKEDLEKTSGVKIDKDTKTDPYRKNNIFRNIIIGGAITLIAIRGVNLVKLLKIKQNPLHTIKTSFKLIWTPLWWLLLW